MQMINIKGGVGICATKHILSSKQKDAIRNLRTDVSTLMAVPY